MNRYHYAGNNPVNNIDPDGYGFWKSFIAAVVGIVATVVTAGLAAPGGFAAVAAAFSGGAQLSAGVMALSGAVGGAFAGATGAALNGASGLGILQSAAFGAVLGGIGGYAGGGGFGKASGWVLGGLFAGGVANAAVNDSWADFAGGLVGGIAGGVAAKSVLNAKFGTLSDSATPVGGDNAGQIVKQVQDGKTSTSDVVMSANNSKGDVGGFASKVEAYVHLNGKEVDSILTNAIAQFPKMGGGSPSGPNWGLIGQGAAELAGGVALQVASMGLLGGSAGTSAGVSAAGISFSVGLIGKGLVDIAQGFRGGVSFGEMLHSAVYGVKQESGILYPYIKAVTGDVPFLP